LFLPLCFSTKNEPHLHRPLSLSGLLPPSLHFVLASLFFDEKRTISIALSPSLACCCYPRRRNWDCRGAPAWSSTEVASCLPRRACLGPTLPMCRLDYRGAPAWNCTEVASCLPRRACLGPTLPMCVADWS
jgi:hypothetical protein